MRNVMTVALGTALGMFAALSLVQVVDLVSRWLASRQVDEQPVKHMKRMLDREAGQQRETTP